MTKENFLTIRWNNVLSLGIGIPTLIYIVVAFSTSMWLSRGGLIGLSLFGALFWLVIELHTVMRFAWLRENKSNYVPVKQASMHPLALIRRAYNITFWVFLLPFFTTMAYGTGFVAFTVVICIRLTLNVYTNNFLNLTPEQHKSYPFRI